MDLCRVEKKTQIGKGGEVKWVVREGIQRGTDNNNGFWDVVWKA